MSESMEEQAGSLSPKTLKQSRISNGDKAMAEATESSCQQNGVDCNGASDAISTNGNEEAEKDGHDASDSIETEIGCKVKDIESVEGQEKKSEVDEEEVMDTQETESKENEKDGDTGDVIEKEDSGTKEPEDCENTERGDETERKDKLNGSDQESIGKDCEEVSLVDGQIEEGHRNSKSDNSKSEKVEPDLNSDLPLETNDTNSDIMKNETDGPDKEMKKGKDEGSEESVKNSSEEKALPEKGSKEEDNKDIENLQDKDKPQIKDKNSNDGEQNERELQKTEGNDDLRKDESASKKLKDSDSNSNKVEANKEEKTLKNDGEKNVHNEKEKEKETEKVVSNSFKRHDSDDIQIVGESKIVSVNTPQGRPVPQNVLFMPPAAGRSDGFPLNQGFPMTNMSSPGFPQGPWMNSHTVGPHGQVLQSGVVGPSGATAAPPQPKSSLDQIELIRWEIHNRVNSRPKYFKPNNSAELGPLAKFLFDIGSDMIKETVYHELVKVQSKKENDDKLTKKEKDDLQKLKDIEKDLHCTIGHLKMKMKKRCKTCHFQTESTNVMFWHKQYPHEQEDKKMHCAHCKFTTKQNMSYKFHMESEHNIQPRIHDRKAFYECDLCPYENNQEAKLVAHKLRCAKQFRPLFNLHPSCLAGAEINLCLENIFYKPAVSKHLKMLQQKHIQQQQALLEAKKQQAQMQALAAQKNAAAIAKRQEQQRLLQQQQQQLRQQQQARMPSPQQIAAAKMPVPRMQSPRMAAPNVKAQRPTVANLLNNRQQGGQGQLGFEVCEICGGYVKDRKALRIHFFYAHRIDLPFNLFERAQAPLYCATCYVRFWTAQGLRKHIDTHKEENISQGVVGKCISCGHHVLNLLIHMRIVHNREIQHYINAMMCMFCGSHFNSRNDVERHIRFVHGNVDPATGTVKAPAINPHQGSSQPSKPAPPKKPSGAGVVKGSVCVLCNLNFGRNVDLTRHCMKMHHTCMKCGMVVIDKASLLKHICLNSPSGTRNCTMCKEKGFHPAYYVKHLRDKHLKKFSIRVARMSKATVERWIKRPYPFQDAASVCVEISDSDDEDNKPLKEIKKASTASPIKKPKIGPAFFMKSMSAQNTPEVVTVDDDDNGKPKGKPDGAEGKSEREERLMSRASRKDSQAHQEKTDNVEEDIENPIPEENESGEKSNVVQKSEKLENSGENNIVGVKGDDNENKSTKESKKESKEDSEKDSKESVLENDIPDTKPVKIENVDANNCQENSTDSKIDSKESEDTNVLEYNNTDVKPDQLENVKAEDGHKNDTESKKKSKESGDTSVTEKVEEEDSGVDSVVSKDKADSKSLTDSKEGKETDIRSECDNPPPEEKEMTDVNSDGDAPSRKRKNPEDELSDSEKSQAKVQKSD